MSKLYVTAGGYALAAILFWLLLGAKQDLGQAIEQCNSEKLAAVAEAERLASIATNDALNRRIIELEDIADREAEARIIAIQARESAEADAVAAQTVIQTLQGQINAESDISQQCLAVTIPDAITERLR